MLPPTRSVMILKFFQVAFFTAARLLPGAQSIQATRYLWTNSVTTSSNLIGARSLSLGRIIFQEFEKIRRLDRHFISRGWPACQVISCESPRRFSMLMARGQKAM